MRRSWPTEGGGAVAPKTNKINSDLNLNFVFHFHCSMYTCPVYTACSVYSLLQFSLPQKDMVVIFASYRYTTLIGGNR
jgi:hypothetical protein